MSSLAGACALCGEQAELLPLADAPAADGAEAEHLLCGPCDELIGQDDSYVAGLSYQDDEAAILEGLAVVEAASEGVTSLCMLSPSIDRKRICRFAAAVLWRAHLSRRAKECDVGDRYAADLRAYLQRRAAFPEHLYVVLVVHLPAPDRFNGIAAIAQAPRSSRERGYYSHSFANRGLQFVFTAGRDSPEAQRALCLHRAAQPFVIVTGEDNMRRALDDRTEGLKPGRKLSRWLMTGGPAGLRNA